MALHCSVRDWLVISIISILSSTTVSSTPITVNTTYGQVTGTRYPTYQEFKGIPFAAPPVGTLRFRAPSPVTPWTTPLDATQDPPGCLQQCVLPNGLCPTKNSEDCLYLNIYTPAEITQLLPVMVFIPGGQFEQGGASCALYDGRYLVGYDVIVVIMNYRLGALGWMYTDGLTPNLGLLDQRMALNYVKDNIKFFGGDPTKVTLFGESAGGSSVTAHLISPYSSGLFSKAIVQSNPVTLPFKSKEIASEVADRFLEQNNGKCKGIPSSQLITCLQSLSSQEVLSASANASTGWLPLLHPLQAGIPFIPIVDDHDISTTAFAALLSGKFNKVPIIWGSTAEEGIMFAYLALSDSMSTVVYYGVLLGIFQSESLNVGELYPAPLFGDKRPLFSTLITDYVFNCPNRNMAIKSANQSSVPIYLYEFNHSLSFDPWGSRYPFCVGHVCHGSELPFLFNTVRLVGYPTTPEEDLLAKNMNIFWTNFAKTGNPNSPLSPSVTWPVVGSANGGVTLILQQDGNAAVVSNNRGQQCDFWDSIGYDWGI